MRILLRVVLGLLPLGLTPLVGHLLAGDVNFGGGEKDILLLVPWLLWSLIFAVSSLVFWRRGYRIAGSLWRSALVGVAGLSILAVALALFGQLGIGGLF